MKKLILFAIIIIISIVILVGYILLPDQPFYISDGISELNQKLQYKYGNKYELSTAYFSYKDKVKPINGDGTNKIIWLGDKIAVSDLRKIAKYGTVITSDIDSRNILQIYGIKTYFIPPFLSTTAALKRHPQFFALVGDPPLVKSILKRKKIQYRTYKITQIAEIIRDLPKFSAISVYPAAMKNYKMINPVLIAAAAQGVPILDSRVSRNNADYTSVFSDNIYYYRDEKEVEEFFDLLQSGKTLDKAEENRKFVARYMTTEKVFERLDDILNKRNTYEDVVQIDIATNAGDYNSGDYWLGKDLALYFQKNGYKTREVYGDSVFKPATKINIVMRGNLSEVDNDLNGQLNILYLAWSNLKVNGVETVMPFDDYIDLIVQKSQGYDILAVSSVKIAAALNKRGIKAIYIPEFTNSEKFYFNPRQNLQSKVLFVGNFHFFRHGPIAAWKHNLPIKIYGRGWPKEIITSGPYIDNNILSTYYSSAEIVLNDTKENMRDFGFITTRIYDATASGAFVISDYIPEIKEVYGDCVPMWQTEEELVDMVNYYLAHEDIRREKALCAQKITLDKFTADKVVKKFIEIIENHNKN